jgi:hypothetical protein
VTNSPQLLAASANSDCNLAFNLSLFSIRKKISIQERIIDIPSQSVITKDNVNNDQQNITRKTKD